ncbi:hypothetical protein ABK040_005217 [Willaertia magna]
MLGDTSNVFLIKTPEGNIKAYPYTIIQTIKEDDDNKMCVLLSENQTQQPVTKKLRLKQNSFNNLPPEIIEIILEYLPFKYICKSKLFFLNKTFNFVLNNLQNYKFYERLKKRFENDYFGYVIEMIDKKICNHSLEDAQDIVLQCLYILNINFNWPDYFVIMKRKKRLLNATKRLLQFASPSVSSNVNIGCDFLELKTLVNFIQQIYKNFNFKKQNSSSQYEYYNDFPIDICLFWLIHNGESEFYGNYNIYLTGYHRLLNLNEIKLKIVEEKKLNLIMNKAFPISTYTGIQQIRCNLENGKIILRSGWNEMEKANSWFDFLLEVLEEKDESIFKVVPLIHNASVCYKF